MPEGGKVCTVYFEETGEYERGGRREDERERRER
jgi:hypothetical protein